MITLKKGDKVKVIADTCSHGYPIGQIRTFKRYIHDVRQNAIYTIEDNEDCHMLPLDYEIIKTKSPIGIWA